MRTVLIRSGASGADAPRSGNRRAADLVPATAAGTMGSPFAAARA